MGLLTTPFPGPCYRPTRRALTRKTLLAWLAERKLATVDQVVDEFDVDRATELRHRTRHRFARDRSEVYDYEGLSERIYRMKKPMPGFIRMASLVVRLKEEGKVYITSDGSNLLPALPTGRPKGGDVP